MEQIWNVTNDRGCALACVWGKMHAIAANGNFKPRRNQFAVCNNRFLCCITHMPCLYVKCLLLVECTVVCQHDAANDRHDSSVQPGDRIRVDETALVKAEVAAVRQFHVHGVGMIGCKNRYIRDVKLKFYICHYLNNP